MAKKTQNITFATLFGADKLSIVSGTSAVETEYTGLQLGFDTIASNAIDTFTVNGNVVNISSSTLSLILPNATAVGADEETGNWIINGAHTNIRARGIDGTVSFDSLSIDQKRELTFTSAVVTTIEPGQPATANIIDHCEGDYQHEGNAVTNASDGRANLGAIINRSNFVNYGFTPAIGNQDIGECPDPDDNPDGYNEWMSQFGDWHPKTGSILLTSRCKGTYDENVTTDLDGNTRNDPPTLGAYEI